eukprot:CAMPEP_0177758556 /NCGR_PEP_ID=MMETSP0491_2-20121128/4250_1 /TAXON_ID=63592 /ORGANISM="Tetraselmis chuii, Strain PLY429" /LENGTH=84 /DNA_ID=CAMNT_0019274303 /DNA_START=623 /DNA_END=878 /DNA_ORIENTATION=+
MSAVAVVDIEVKDHHPLQPMHILCMPGHDRDGVEEAEAHRPSRDCMMAWWPAHAEACRCYAMLAPRALDDATTVSTSCMPAPAE